MREVLEEIKAQHFQKAYLFYGEEKYLKQQYRQKLLHALLPEGDTMNFSRYSGKDADEQEIIAMAEVLPFFAERRVILLENTGFFKNKTELLADYVTRMPDYLVMLFVEDEVDKRSRLYKAVQKQGRIVQFAAQKEDTLMRWVLGQIRRDSKKISRKDAEYFLSLCGTDMTNIHSELEKLLCYVLDREAITREDIDAVCVPQISNRIFDMVRSVAAHEKQKALEEYYDLLAQKEPAMRILFLLAREFNLLLQVKTFLEENTDPREVASVVGIPPFAAGRYRALAKRYSVGELEKIVRDLVKTEEDVKTGRLGDVLSVELMLIRYAE